jgi:hypothetical protein
MKQNLGLCILIVVFASGCGLNSDKKRELIIFGRNNVPVLQQFHSAFPDSTSHIAHFRGAGSNLSLGSAVVHKGRYLIKVFFDIEVTDEGFTKISDAHFRIAEVTRAVKNESGGISISFSKRQTSFSEAEWEKIYKNDLDFSLIGYEFENTDPIEDLSDLVAESLKNN